MSVAQIIEGWRNNLFPSDDMKDVIEAVHKERMSICDTCPKHSKWAKTIRLDDHCTDCGCTLSAKTKCLSCKCPLDKWGVVITEEEENKLKENAYNLS